MFHELICGCLVDTEKNIIIPSLICKDDFILIDNIEYDKSLISLN